MSVARSYPWCKEYRKVDSVLKSFEEEKRDEFSGGHLLKKMIRILDMYHNNSNNLEATFVKLSEKRYFFITEFIDIWFCHCDGQKTE